MRNLLFPVALILPVALALVLPVAHADAEPISPEVYWRRIDALAALLEETPADPVAVRAAVDALEVDAVRVPGGPTLPVDNGALLATLREGELDAARAQLAALQQLRAETAPPSTRAAEEAFAGLDEILSRPEFSEVVVAPSPASLPQQIVDGLRRALARGLNRLGHVPGLEYGLTLVGLAVVFTALAFAFRSTWRQWVAEEGERAEGAVDDVEELSSDQARQRAGALATAGDYRQAVRYLYLSTLLWLDEGRVLRYDPALTNREFLHQVAADVERDQLRVALTPVVELFDRVWYGFFPLDRRAYAAFVRQVERVRQVAE